MTIKAPFRFLSEHAEEGKLTGTIMCLDLKRFVWTWMSSKLYSQLLQCLSIDVSIYYNVSKDVLGIITTVLNHYNRKRDDKSIKIILVPSVFHKAWCLCRNFNIVLWCCLSPETVCPLGILVRAKQKYQTERKYVGMDY